MKDDTSPRLSQDLIASRKIVRLLVGTVTHSCLLTAFLIFGGAIAMSQTNPPSQKNPAEIGRALRSMMLTAPPKNLGIQPTKSFPRVYGVLMDWPLQNGTATIVSLCDGNASLYTTSTFGIIGGVAHESVRAAAIQFVATAERHFDAAVPTKEYPYPQPGHVRFYLTCFDGVRMIEAEEASLKTGKDKYSELWKVGQQVIAELHSITQKADKKP
ncbi:MAG: hypothetical protein JWR19_2905 [Pedosphaera sp.]|nr:hypothetical protein [Pedosphaera sp.]